MILPEFNVFHNAVTLFHELGRLSHMNVLGSAHNNGLDPFVAHNRTDAAPAGAGTALFDGGIKYPVFAGQADGRHLGFGFVELFSDELGCFVGAFALEVGGVPDFHCVVVDPQIYQIRRFAPQYHLVISRVFQFRRKESPHHGKMHQLGLGRYGGYDGPVAPDGRCAA